MKRYFAILVALVMISVAFVGITPSEVESLDTASVPLTQTDLTAEFLWTGITDMYCADWMDGDYALVAGESTMADEHVALFDYTTDTWSSIPGAAPITAGTRFTDMDDGEFTDGPMAGPDEDTWLLSANDGNVYYYNWTTNTVTSLANIAPNALRAVAAGSDDFYVANQTKVWYVQDTGASWLSTQVTGLSYEIRDLAIHPLTGDLIIISTWTSAMRNIDVDTVPWGTTAANWNNTLNNVALMPSRIAWNPSALVPGDETDYGLIACENGSIAEIHMNMAHEDNTISLAGAFGTSNGFHLNGIDWVDNPYQAVVGGVGGLLYKLQPDGSWINETVVNPLYTTINDVSYRPANSPSFAMMPSMNSGGTTYLTQLNDVTVGQNINVNTLYPHINYIDLYTDSAILSEILDDSSTDSVLNGRVDVDSGSGTTSYQLAVNISHLGGWSEVNYTNVKGWYDGIATGAGSTYAESGGNLAFQFNYTPWNNTAWQTYPSTGEITLDANQSYSINSTVHMVIFNFTMYQQVRAADGSGSFVEAQGVRYGGGPELQSDINALNRADTWDLNITVEDHGGGYAYSYDEFGIYRYTSLSVSGLPGDLYGQGAPNQLMTLTPVDNVTFSSNYDYGLYVYIQSDLIGQSFGQTLAATTFYLDGGDMGGSTQFGGAGPGNPLYLLSQWRAAEDAGTTTNTSNADGAGPNTPVTWTCNPGSVVEDLYTGTAIYIIEHL